MVTQLQPDVRAYLHGGEVIKRYIRIEEVAHEYGFSVEETEYIAKAASSLYKLTRIHLVKKERFDEFMKHIYKVPGTNKQIIKKFARIGEASIIYSIGRHRFIELARAAGATYKINEGTGGSIDVVPVPKDLTTKVLQKKYLGIESDIIKQQRVRNKNNDFSTEISYAKRTEKKEIEEIMDDVRENDQCLFFVGVTIILMAESNRVCLLRKSKEIQII